MEARISLPESHNFSSMVAIARAILCCSEISYRLPLFYVHINQSKSYLCKCFDFMKLYFPHIQPYVWKGQDEFSSCNGRLQWVSHRQNVHGQNSETVSVSDKEAMKQIKQNVNFDLEEIFGLDYQFYYYLSLSTSD